MRTLTMLCAAVLCALPHFQQLKAQDAPIIVADNSSLPPPATGKKGEQEKNSKKKRTTVAARTIKHSDGFTTVTAKLYFANDPPSSTNTPVCFEMDHDPNICAHAANPQACRDQYYVDLSSAATWSLALNGGVVLPWHPDVSNMVPVNTDGAMIISSSQGISDTNALTIGTLTVTLPNGSTQTSTFPGSLMWTPPLTFRIHYCNGNCVGDDHTDHCKNHQ